LASQENNIVFILIIPIHSKREPKKNNYNLDQPCGILALLPLCLTLRSRPSTKFKNEIRHIHW